MERHESLFRFDENFSGAEEAIVAGLDEAGRGPLAGPVVAAAVMFRKKGISLPGLNDSKKLSPRLRERLFGQIVGHALVGIGRSSESVIDEVNILEATRLAMREAVLALPLTPNLLLIDGQIQLDLPIHQVSIIRGDGQSAAIASASIVAKVCRDHWMRQLDRLYPSYGFAVHKGYPTPTHLEELRRRGATEVHRKTFRPVAEVLESFGLGRSGADT